MSEKSPSVITPELRLKAEKLYLEKTQVAHATLNLQDSKALLRELQIKLFEMELEKERFLGEQLKLEASYQKYFSLYLLAPMSFLIVSENGVILECNLSASKLLGFSQSELINKQIIDLIHPSDHEIYYCQKEKYFDENILNQCKLRVLKNNGSELWVKLEPLVVVDILGNPIFGFVLSDITTQKQIEHKNELEESEKEAIINSTTDTIWSVTKDLKLITCNKSFLDSTKAFSGASFKVGDDVLQRNFFPKEVIEFWEKLYLKALEGNTAKAEFYNGSKGSYPETWLEVVINPIYWNGELTSLACFGRNITERKLNEQKLLHSAKMASLGEMAGGVAHEINNPLSILLGYSSKINRLLSVPNPNIPLIQADLEKIKETTRRISSIIVGLRSFSRNAENDPFVSTSVRSIIVDTLGLCQERFRINSIEIKMESIPELFCECRATQISQVLLNLFNNAYDAIACLSTKWIQVEVMVLSEARFKIVVTDCGSGIPTSIIDKLMQPFFTTKEVGKGTGLGLSVSLGIVQGHGGSISIDRNCPNTRFVIELPFKQFN